jgi:hypothetical protein
MGANGGCWELQHLIFVMMPALSGCTDDRLYIVSSTAGAALPVYASIAATCTSSSPPPTAATPPVVGNLVAFQPIALKTLHTNPMACHAICNTHAHGFFFMACCSGYGLMGLIIINLVYQQQDFMPFSDRARHDAMA